MIKPCLWLEDSKDRPEGLVKRDAQGATPALLEPVCP